MKAPCEKAKWRNQYFFGKPLDKKLKNDIIIALAKKREATLMRINPQKTLKKSKKVLKKVLTSGRVSDIIVKLSARTATIAETRAQIFARIFAELAKRVRSLKIEQQREKYKAKFMQKHKVCEIQNLAILKENTTQNKSKTSKSSLVDWIAS
jgi:hypothetical protein